MESLNGSPMLIFIILGIAGFLASFILGAVWFKIGKLETADTELLKQFNTLSLLVAGEYVKRSEIEPQLKEIATDIKELRKDLAVSRKND